MIEDISQVKIISAQRSRSAAWLMLALWLVYITVYTLPFESTLEAILEAMAGASGIAVLLLVGFTRHELYLQVRSISKLGLLALGIATLALAGPLSVGKFEGVRWLPLLVYAPLSGVSQELFFRASLLPTIQKLCGNKTWSALLIHAILFGLWHVPLAYLAAPISPWIAVLALFLVTSSAGLAWGWQVQHDRTVIWAMLHHTILLMVMSLYV